jgi:hypothetical protein
MSYMIQSKIGETRLHHTMESAIDEFERICKRSRVQPPLHYPPEVSGDGTERFRWGIRYQGPRDGHGTVFVEDHF